LADFSSFGVNVIGGGYWRRPAEGQHEKRTGNNGSNDRIRTNDDVAAEVHLVRASLRSGHGSRASSGRVPGCEHEDRAFAGWAITIKFSLGDLLAGDATVFDQVAAIERCSLELKRRIEEELPGSAATVVRCARQTQVHAPDGLSPEEETVTKKDGEGIERRIRSAAVGCADSVFPFSTDVRHVPA
jgi:hypothetical protein